MNDNEYLSKNKVDSSNNKKIGNSQSKSIVDSKSNNISFSNSSHANSSTTKSKIDKNKISTKTIQTVVTNDTNQKSKIIDNKRNYFFGFLVVFSPVLIWIILIGLLKSEILIDANILILSVIGSLILLCLPIEDIFDIEEEKCTTWRGVSFFISVLLFLFYIRCTI